MQFGIISSMLMGLLILLVSKSSEVKGDCACSERTAKTNGNIIIGNCKVPDYKPESEEHYGKTWCYLKKDTNPECCQGTTQRFVGWCVNYDLCNQKPKCKCSDKTITNAAGDTIGNCLSRDDREDAKESKGRLWCYVDENSDEECCQGATARFLDGTCINYDACPDGRFGRK